MSPIYCRKSYMICKIQPLSTTSSDIGGHSSHCLLFRGCRTRLPEIPAYVHHFQFHFLLINSTYYNVYDNIRQRQRN